MDDSTSSTNHNTCSTQPYNHNNNNNNATTTKTKRNRNKSHRKKKQTQSAATVDSTTTHTHTDSLSADHTATNTLQHNITMNKSNNTRSSTKHSKKNSKQHHTSSTPEHIDTTEISTPTKLSRSQCRAAKLAATDNHKNKSQSYHSQRECNYNMHNQQRPNQKYRSDRSYHHKPHYKPYLTQNEIQHELELGTLVRGVLRSITLTTAFVTCDGEQKFAADVLIDGRSACNRALDGDIVAVRLYDAKQLQRMQQHKHRKSHNIINHPNSNTYTAQSNNHTPNTKPSLSAKLNNLVVRARADADRQIAAEQQKHNANSTQSHSAGSSGSDSTELDRQSILTRKYAIDVAKQQNQRVGEIVGIIQQKHSRLVSCFIKWSVSIQNLLDNNIKYKSIEHLHSVTLSLQAMPLDKKNPASYISYNDLPDTARDIIIQLRQLFPLQPSSDNNNDNKHSHHLTTTVDQHIFNTLAEQADTVSRQIYIAKYTAWNESDAYPTLLIERVLGLAGDIDSETNAILALNGITYDIHDFPDDVNNDIAMYKNWSITDNDVKSRRDYRQTRIFTIDPITARDLDDSLHITQLSDDVYEIGVHIADVSYFVKAGTSLDSEAQDRATSVYMTQMVVPMLPRILCEQLCSLNPGVDRLAYSCVFQMNTQGEVVNRENTWFGRSIINSCAKLDYGTAQQMIDCDLSNITDSSVLTGADRVATSAHTINDIISDVKILNEIAQKRRAYRFSDRGGSLSLTNVKLAYELDDHYLPTSFRVYDIYDSNRLIEEYMLLANALVAEKITSYTATCAYALLRCHPAPSEISMMNVLANLAQYGFYIDASTAGSIHSSLSKLSDVVIGNLKLNAKSLIESLATKPMEQAKYFCTADLPRDQWKHYALNFDRYTHFTSPIRRYADITVHRILDLIVQYEQLVTQHNNPYQSIEQYQLDVYPLLCTESTTVIAQQCNTRKVAAKKAQDQSTRLYLTVYIHQLAERHQPPLQTHAVICGIQQNTFDIVLPEYGIGKRIFIEDILDSAYIKQCTISEADENESIIIIQWCNDTISKYHMFDGMRVELGARMTPPIDVTITLISAIDANTSKQQTKQIQLNNTNQHSHIGTPPQQNNKPAHAINNTTCQASNLPHQLNQRNSTGNINHIKPSPQQIQIEQHIDSMIRGDHRQYILGIDVSTQSIKGIIIDQASQQVLDTRQYIYQQHLPQYNTLNGVHYDAESLCIDSHKHSKKTVSTPILMLLDAVDLLMSNIPTDVRHYIVGISISAQQHGSVYCNNTIQSRLSTLSAKHSLSEQLHDCFTLADCPIWMDSSTDEQCHQLIQQCNGVNELSRLCGSRAYMRFTLPQIMKIRQYCPNVYQSTSHISLISSFITSVLAGKLTPIDSSDGCGMNAINYRTGKWLTGPQNHHIVDGELLSKLGGEPSSAHTVVGAISPYYVNRYNMTSSCNIICGTGDNVSSMVGMNLMQSGDLGISLGTSDTLFSITNIDQYKPNCNYGFILRHPITNNLGMIMNVYSNGSVVRQELRDSILGKQTDWNKFNDVISEQHGMNYSKLMTLTYINHEITPTVTQHTGMYVYGIFDNTQPQLIRHVQHVNDTTLYQLQCCAISRDQLLYSIIEGQIIRLVHHAVQLGCDINACKRIVVTGGASNNNVILQLISDIFQCDVYVLSSNIDGAAYGAAARAQIALYGQQHQQTNHHKLQCQPNARYADRYQARLHMYKLCEQHVMKRNS